MEFFSAKILFTLSVLAKIVLSGDTLQLQHSFSILQPESCEWNAATSQWYFSNQINHTIHLYSSDGVAQSWFDDDELMNPAGMVINGDVLYVASFGTGKVIAFDATNGTKIRTYDFGDHNVNGLCLDTVNNRLFVTDIGLNVGEQLSASNKQGMWAVDLDDDTMFEILNSSMNYYPNGCVYNPDDQMVYACQTNLGFSGAGNNKILMVAWDSVMYTVTEATGGLGDWNTAADGIILTNDGDLYITSWGSFSIGTGFINVYNWVEWTLAMSGLSGPADIGYDSTNNRVCIPNYLSNVGMITTIEEDISSTMMFTTSGPTMFTPAPTTTDGAVQISMYYSFYCIVFSAIVIFVFLD